MVDSTDKIIEITENSDVIIPPDNIKPIIETTALYVAKRGTGLEKQIFERQKDNAKFAFLNPANPYHAFYKKRIESLSASEPEENKELNAAESLLKTDKAKDKAPKPVSEPQKPANPVQNDAKNTEEGEKPLDFASKPSKKPLLDRIKSIIAESVEPKEVYVCEETEFHFDVRPPPDVVAIDIEIIKLTAQFAAANGRSFLATVSNREQKNPQFAFLKPSNASLFLYFSDLVQAYQRILSPPKDAIDEIERESKDTAVVLNKLLGAAEFKDREKRRVELAKQNKEEEKREMQLYDWHSFVILETIEFNDGDDEYLPPPSMTIDEINQQIEAERRLTENIEKVGAKITDDADLPPEDSSDQDVQMMDADHDAPPSAAATPAKEPSQKCTVCGKLVPVSEIENHVRIELLDPKWREQRLAARAKAGDHTMASAEEMAANLRDFVRVRKRPFADAPPRTVDERAVFGAQAAAKPVPEAVVRTSATPSAVVPLVAGSGASVTVMAPAQPMPMPTGSGPPVGIMLPSLTHLTPFGSGPPVGMMQPPQQPFGSGPPVGMMQPPQPPVRVMAAMSRGSMTAGEMTGLAEKTNLMPEDQYLRTHSENVVVVVRIPVDESKQDWNFNGQTLSLPMQLANKISDVKTHLSKKLKNMPEKKMKLKVINGGFLKNDLSLAYYNISSAVILELGVKARGRRK